MARHSLLLSMLLLSLAACDDREVPASPTQITIAGAAGSSELGGTGGLSGSSGQPGIAGSSPGAAGAPAPGAPEFVKAGSYDAELTYTKNGYCVAAFLDDGKAPRARIDLRQDTTGHWSSSVAFDGQAPADLSVTVTGTGLTLDGIVSEGNLTGHQEKFYTNTWRRFTLSKPSAGPGIDVQVEGTSESSDGGDAGCLSTPVAMAGLLVADATAPTAHLEHVPLPGRLRQVLLPWDPVVVRLSEPLDPAAIMGALAVTGALGGQPTAWTLPTELPYGPLDADKPSVMGAHALFARGPWADGASLQLMQKGPLADPSGHAVSMPTATLQVIDAGGPQASLDLDAGAPPGLWGSAKHLTTGGGSECESGGCVDLGKSRHACPLPLSGMAARLQVPDGATQLHIRTRLLVENEPGVLGTVFPQPSFVEMRSGGQTQPFAPLYESPSDVILEPLATPDPPLLSRTPWQTRSLPLPPLGADRVLELSVFLGVTQIPDCIFPHTPNPTTRVLVDRIWTD